MDNDVELLYSSALKLLLDKEAKHKQFFTQDEFEKNMGQIYILSKAKSDIYKKLKSE